MRYPSGRRLSFGFGSRLTPVVVWLIGLYVGVFLLWIFGTDATRTLLAQWLVLTPRALLDGHIWTLLTSPLVSTSGFEFFMDLLMLWMFVPVMEQHLGTRRFIRFAAITSVTAGLVAALLGLLLGGVSTLTPITGLSPFIFACVAGYGTAFANQPVQLFGVVPLKGKVLAIGTAVFLGIFTFLNQRWVTGAGYFAAMALAWAWIGGAITPNLWWLKWRRARLRRRYTVLSGGTSGDSDTGGKPRDGGSAPRGAKPKPAPGRPSKKQWLN
jgi:rhomboid family protein